MSSFLSTNVCELTTEVSDNTLSMPWSESEQTVKENAIKSLKHLIQYGFDINFPGTLF